MAVDVDPMFAAAVSEAEGTLNEVTFIGEKFTVVDNPPQGAFLMFCRRIDTKDMSLKASATVRLLEAWIIPDDHDRLFEAIEKVVDLEKFMEVDVAEFLQQVTNRPTSAPSS